MRRHNIRVAHALHPRRRRQHDDLGAGELVDTDDGVLLAVDQVDLDSLLLRHVAQGVVEADDDVDRTGD